MRSVPLEFQWRSYRTNNRSSNANVRYAAKILLLWLMTSRSAVSQYYARISIANVTQAPIKVGGRETMAIT